MTSIIDQEYQVHQQRVKYFVPLVFVVFNGSCYLLLVIRYEGQMYGLEELV